MNSTERITNLKAEILRNHARIQQCLKDLHSKIDHLIELHAEFRRSAPSRNAEEALYCRGGCQ